MIFLLFFGFYFRVGLLWIVDIGLGKFYVWFGDVGVREVGRGGERGVGNLAMLLGVGYRRVSWGY